MKHPLETAAKLACYDIYSPITNDVFNNIITVGDTVCGVSIQVNVCYIVNQGTENLKGWESDFNVKPISHPVLGNLHSGFYSNLPQVVDKLLPLIPKDMMVFCCGHSKGAAEASILSALLLLEGVNVVQNYLFACPNAGYKQLSDWLKENIRGTSYKNSSVYIPFLSDPIPNVPLSPYSPPYPHTIITEYPEGLKFLLPSNWHSSKLYWKKIAP
jgi:hypothetical protein